MKHSNGGARIRAQLMIIATKSTKNTKYYFYVRVISWPTKPHKKIKFLVRSSWPLRRLTLALPSDFLLLLAPWIWTAFIQREVSVFRIRHSTIRIPFPVYHYWMWDQSEFILIFPIIFSMLAYWWSAGRIGIIWNIVKKRYFTDDTSLHRSDIIRRIEHSF